MSDKEKLIELMQEAYCCVTCGYGDQDKVKWLLECDIEVNWEDIADHLIANGVGFLPCKFDGDRCYIPLSNGQKYCTSYEAKMKEVR